MCIVNCNYCKYGQVKDIWNDFDDLVMYCRKDKNIENKRISTYKGCWDKEDLYCDNFRLKFIPKKITSFIDCINLPNRMATKLVEFLYSVYKPDFTRLEEKANIFILRFNKQDFLLKFRGPVSNMEMMEGIISVSNFIHVSDNVLRFNTDNNWIRINNNIDKLVEDIDKAKLDRCIILEVKVPDIFKPIKQNNQ